MMETDPHTDIVHVVNQNNMMDDFVLLAPYILFDYINLIPTNVHSLCDLTQVFIIKKCPTSFKSIF
jgi:flagellar assembly factor FliW